MADVFTPPGGFADISAFVADGNAINAATKTALNTGLSNISLLFGDYSVASGVTIAAHPDFNKIDPAARQKIQNEITALKTAITNHA